MSLSEGNYFELKEIGDRFYRAKKWEHALAAYSEAEKLNEDAASEDDDLHFKRGYILFALKRIDDSRDAYEACVALDENHSAAWQNLALCHQILENWTDAQESYQKAAELSPESTKCWEGLALCASKLDDKELRITAVETLAKLLPGSSHWLNEVGRAHLVSGQASGKWRALAAFLESSRLNGDACHPNNAAIVYRKLNKWLDAADAYLEALHRQPGYSNSEKGLEEIKPYLEEISQKVRDFAATQPPCKQPYQRYLNPFEVLAVNEALRDRPSGAALRKLKQMVIQQIQLNDGHADWLQGVEIGESRVRQVLDDLDRGDEVKATWHWVIYNCPELNRFLSHGDPHYFSFFAAHSALPQVTRPPYWQMRNEKHEEENFFAFISAPFLANFEELLAQAIDLNDALLVKALSSGRLPAIDAFDYFRRANQWLTARAAAIRASRETLNTSEGITSWSKTPGPLEWLSVPLVNSLPDECKMCRTELGRELRALAIDLHNSYDLTNASLTVITMASKLLVDDSLIEELEADRKAITKILATKKLQEAKWNKVINTGTFKIEIMSSHIKLNDLLIPEKRITGVSFYISNTHPCIACINIATVDGTFPCWLSGSSRTNTQIAADLKSILESIFHYFTQNIVKRQAETVAAGLEVPPTGPLRLTAGGIQFETGSLWWKKQMTVPYSAWTFKKSPGKVHAVAYQGRFDFELNFLMNNAIIIEDIVAAIKVIQTQAK